MKAHRMLQKEILELKASERNLIKQECMGIKLYNAYVVIQRATFSKNS